MNLLGMLHTFERVTRPLGHDTDMPAAGPEAFFDAYKLTGATTEPPLSTDELTAVRLVIHPLMQAHAEEVADTEAVGVERFSDEGWVAPAICEVLADHTPAEQGAGDGLACYQQWTGGPAPQYHAKFTDWQAWREHVAPLIAERLKSAAQTADRGERSWRHSIGEAALREMRDAEKRVDQALRRRDPGSGCTSHPLDVD